MPRKKKRKQGAMIVAFIILLVFAVGFIYAATNGFSAKIKTFALKRNGKDLILNDTSGLRFAPEEKFEIVNLTSTSRDFFVKVYAYGDEENDFEYKYLEENGYSWREFAADTNKDFTSCFDFSFEGNVLTFRNDGFKAAVARYDSKIIIPEQYPAGDKFVLVIYSGDEAISLGFSCLEEVEGLTIEPGNVVF